MTATHDDYAFEPIPGLPAPLPHGENILWQGKPDWQQLAVSAFHCRKVAIYFAIIMAFQAVTGVMAGNGLGQLLADFVGMMFWAGAALGILLTLAYLSARVSIYTITNKRVLIRFGIALQMTVNLPFSQIVSADMRRQQGNFGDIPLTVRDTRRVNSVVLWPHVKPFSIGAPKPMLRAIADVDHVADVLAVAFQQERPGIVETIDTAAAPRVVRTLTEAS